MTARFLLYRLVRFRLHAVAGLAGTALILAAASLLTNVLEASVTTAAEQSIRTENGDRKFAVQVLDQQSALPVLSRRTDLLPVVDGASRVVVPDADSLADLRVVDDPSARMGLLTEGSYPDRPGEATVSSSLATSLGLHVGQEAVLVPDEAGEGQRIRITGVTSSPAHADDVTVVLMRNEVDPREATAFLTDTDPFADESLSPLLEQRALNGRTVARLGQDEGAATRTALLSHLGYAAVILGILSLCLILSLLATLGRQARRDVAALQASGMTPVDSWRLVGYAATYAVLAGTVLGSCLALAAVTMGSSYISGLLGQDWQTIAVSWEPFAVYAVGIPSVVLLVVLALPPILLTGGRRQLPEVNLSSRSAACVVALWVVIVGLTVAQILPVQIGGVWGAAAAFVAPALIGTLAVRGAARGERRVIHAVTRAMMPILVVTALLIWGATTYSAAAAHNAISMRDTSAAVQPPGSLLVYEVPSASGLVLSEEYRRLGGERVAPYILPVESSAQVRAASALIVDCMRRGNITNPDYVDPTCVPYDSASTVNIVALSSGTSSQVITADPSLIEGGRLGLLVFTPQSGGAAVQITESLASPDALLGGNMPGAVIPVDGTLAKSLNLRAADSELIAFLDFAALPLRAQARFRSDVARLAGAAQVAEERSQYGDVAVQFAISRASAATGVCLLLLLLGFGGATVITSHARLRRTLTDIGCLPRQRRVLVTRIFATPVATVIVAAGLGRFSAWLQGVHDGTGFGWLWLLPGSAALVACVALGLAFYRVPSRMVA